MTEAVEGVPAIDIVPLEALRAAVTRADALEAAESAFRALAEGRVSLPPPLGLHLPDVEGEVHVKGAWIRGADTFAFKVASGFYRNPERGLPSGSGLFLVFDAETGVPLALLQDHGWLTDLRTAAAGALAARLLTPEDRPLRVGVVGAGAQARFQLRALAEVREVERVRIWSPSREASGAAAADLAEGVGFPLEAVATVEAAVRDADLVLTVTPAREPLVRAEWLAEAATVIAVGSDGEGKQELEPAVLARARVVCDRTEQCARLGELQHALAAGVMERADVSAELGEVLTGARPGREGRERIVVDLTGVGAQDAAIAEVAWLRTGGAG